MPTKKPTVAKLKKKLWTIFSEYIRLRDAGTNGYCNCISCSRTHHYKDIHAGHFIPKSRGLNIYFNEQNVNAQCSYCNLYLHGNQYAYSKALDRKYGEGTADNLLEESTKIVKWSTQDFLDKIDYYKKAVEKITR